MSIRRSSKQHRRSLCIDAERSIVNVRFRHSLVEAHSRLSDQTCLYLLNNRCTWVIILCPCIWREPNIVVIISACVIFSFKFIQIKFQSAFFFFLECNLGNCIYCDFADVCVDCNNGYALTNNTCAGKSAYALSIGLLHFYRCYGFDVILRQLL